MHPYLTRLGVGNEVQEFFAPYYRADKTGNLEFNYGEDAESYGLAFHRIPITNHLWNAGQHNFRMVRQVFITGSAMEAISYLHFHWQNFRDLEDLLFLAVGTTLRESHIEWINANLSEKKYNLLFSNDFLGKVTGLKTAAGIRRVPVAVYEQDGICSVSFRHQHYKLPSAGFSLNAFEKLSRYRFGIRTLKPKGYTIFFDQLKASAF